MIFRYERVGIKLEQVGNSKEALMFIDTGSNLSSITSSEANAIGINVESLNHMDVGGIGGITKTPIANNIGFYLIDDKGNPHSLIMDKIAISNDSVMRVREKSKGIFKQTRTVEASMFDLFGLDALKKLNATLCLNLNKESGEIIF